MKKCAENGGKALIINRFRSISIMVKFLLGQPTVSLFVFCSPIAMTRLSVLFNVQHRRTKQGGWVDADRSQLGSCR